MFGEIRMESGRAMYGSWSACRRRRGRRPPGDPSSHVGRGDLLSARAGTWRTDKLRGEPGHHQAEQESGLEDGQGHRRPAERFRTRRLDGPCTSVAADALVLEVRESGLVVGVNAL